MKATARAAAVLAIPLAAGCVSYRPDAVSAPESDARLSVRRDGPLSFEDAVRLLVDRNPDLVALRAEAAGINLTPIGTTGAISHDLLGLFGLGPRAAERALARAMRDEVFVRHHERARDLVADLAEAYAVDRVLGALASAHPELDVEPYREAGLVSDADVAAARAVHAEADAEARVVAVEIRDVRRRIAELVGASPDSGILPLAPPPDWPPVADATARGLLYARGDLQRLGAEYVVADRRYRAAVAGQLPGVGVSIPLDLDFSDPLSLMEIDLPLGAPTEARAQFGARTAAKRRFDAGVFAALHDAASERLALESAEAEAEAARERRKAADALVKASQTRVQVETGAIADLVIVAGEEVSAARELRKAEVERARARVRAARAAGWPGPEVAGGCR